MHEEAVEKKMKTVTDVVLYSRIGHDKFGTASLDVQDKIMREFAEKNKLRVLDTFREITCGYYGEWSRPVLREAMESIRHKKHIAIMSSSVDRLTKQAGYLANMMEDSRSRFIIVKHGVYYKTMPLQFDAILVEDAYRQKCEALGVEMLRQTKEGWLKFSKHMKPAIQGLLDAGLTMADVEKKLHWTERPYFPCIDGWGWTPEQIKKVIALG